MKLYNTLTRKKEDFRPINDSLVKIYTCGPTVYQYAHIGNLRAYLFMDSLRRALKHNGFTLQHVMNITDVGHLVSDADEGEDKMEKSAREQQKSPLEIAAYYTDVFMKDIARLNIDKPEIVAKATDNISEMIDFVEKLVEKGYGYETSDGIYFNIEKFKDYGKLSRMNFDEQQAGARVEVNSEKRHPADFALWKKAQKERLQQWESPWGMGFPGWHIECSAMGLKYLGEEFDIHTGGVDHIPIHHENEIAQSEALLDHSAVNIWMHSEFLLVDGGKMSKSLGNCYTLSDLDDRGYSPLCYRYFCLNAHYRSKLNFTFDGMDAAKKSLNNLITAVQSHKDADGKIESDIIDGFRKDFFDAVNDDLNIPKALGVVWSMARYATKSDAMYQLILEADKILGLDLHINANQGQSDDLLDLGQEIEARVRDRHAARKSRNFAEADKIRNELNQQGITLEDMPNGVKVIIDGRSHVVEFD
ncbi:MAG: cysteine--tRNA ligase [Eubacteriales bacterium]|jgi:cysteinyl-tRNA synthetase